VADSLSKAQRSDLMARVRGKGNESTEVKVQLRLQEAGIRGWRKHPSTVPGHPDFYFPRLRLAVFVDGCFWHSCPRCGRLPKSRRTFWARKIEGNRRRDETTRRALRRRGYQTLRIWEHEVANDRWMSRLRRVLEEVHRKEDAARRTFAGEAATD